MDKIWAPWLASAVASECINRVIDIDSTLADFDMPVEGWHASVAEILSSRGHMFEEPWPPTDREMLAWLRMRPDLLAEPDLRLAGQVLIRASDESICLTLGNGRVGESWGGGLVVNYFPTAARYSAAYELPYVIYLKGSRRGIEV